MKNLALIALVFFVAAFQPRPFAPAMAGDSYGTVLAQWGGPHYVRAGEFVGRSENQPPTSNLAALTPFVCQHDLIIERIDVWAQVHGPYTATIWMASRASYVAPPSYSATAMAATVPSTGNFASSEDNPVFCRKGDFLLIHIDTDVNPEYITVFARIGQWNP